MVELEAPVVKEVKRISLKGNSNRKTDSTAGILKSSQPAIQLYEPKASSKDGANDERKLAYLVNPMAQLTNPIDKASEGNGHANGHSLNYNGRYPPHQQSRS